MPARAILLASLALAGLCTTGCASLSTTPGAVQLATTGDVELTLDVCATGADGCPASAVPAENATDPSRPAGPLGRMQLLVAFRVPVGTGLPAAFASLSPVGLAFARSASYTAQLTTASPPPADELWVGYVSDPFSYDSSAGPQAIRLRVTAQLPRPDDGTPYRGPFSWRPVVGVRANDSTSRPIAPADPVTCDGTLAAAVGSDFLDACVDASSLAGGLVPPDLSLTTNDLGIPPAGVAAVAADGATASLPFVLQWDGPAVPSAAWQLAATTDLPGGRAAPSTPALVLGASSTVRVPVAVTVPAGAPVGHYHVTLTASLAGGQSRTGTGLLTVEPAGAGTSAGTPGGAGGGAVPGADGGSVAAIWLRVRGAFRRAEARRDGIPITLESSRTGVARLLLRGRSGRRLAGRSVALVADRQRHLRWRVRGLSVGPITLVATIAGAPAKVRVLQVR